KTMAAVPSGLPVLPPHWIFTVNVWTYEIVGKYQVFTVIDNDNEVIPAPYFGHKGQRYVREKQSITLNGNYLGENEPIVFRFNGYASTVVGSGPKGVGDKVEGNTEVSAGYQDLLLENGG
ncbi:MAG: DUF7286 family protein, partial [Methanosarcina sp.]